VGTRILILLGGDQLLKQSYLSYIFYLKKHHAPITKDLKIIRRRKKKHEIMWP
jgi:hypothetical protein